MAKIIKLTESDLEMIVKKVINEQLAQPTVKSGQKGTTVMDLQRALKYKGYDLGKSGPNKDGIDGDFGNVTKNALIQFQRKSNIRPTGQLDQSTRNSLFVGMINPNSQFGFSNKPLIPPSNNKKTTQSKPTQSKPTQSKPTQSKPTQGDGFFTSMVKKVKNAVSEIEDFFALPLHIRAFMKFTGLNRKPFTLNDLTKDEQAAIKQMLSYAEKKGMIKNGKIVNFYGIANALNDGTEKIDFKDKKSLGLDQGNIKSQYTRVAMTLGNATVSKSGNNYIIKDTYDFNNFINNPEKYTLAETPKTVANALKNIGTGNYVQGVEELASYYQKLGYPGYPVDIMV